MATNNYEQTKSYCKFRGIITGLVNPRKGYGYSEGVDSRGNKYRSLRFSIKTSEGNIIPVEIYGGVQTKAYFYSRAKKHTKEVPWDKRLGTNFEGYEAIVTDYDKASDIYKTFHEGDSVVIIGEVVHSEYLPKGKTIPEYQTKYIIKNIYKTENEIDFNVKDFVEESIFEEEIVVSEITEDKKENKLYLFAYTIAYGDKFIPCKFEIKCDEADVRFIKNLKSLSYGDFLKVSGYIHNRAVAEQVDVDDGWGQKVRAITTFYKAQEITGAYGESLVKRRYTENEIKNAIQIAEEKVKAKNPTFNPIKQNTEIAKEAFAPSDDDLPFNINM